MPSSPTYSTSWTLFNLHHKYTNLHGGTYSLRKLFSTHFPTLSNKNFLKNFWALFWGLKCSCHIFSDYFSPCVSPYFSRFLLQGCLVHLHPSPVIILYRSEKDGDLWRHTTPSLCNNPSTKLRGARSLYTRASITLSRWRRCANNMLQDFIIIRQSNTPISTAAPTHYLMFYTHTFLILFQNFSFSKIFGPFFGARGILHSIFWFPFFHYVSTYFIRSFELFFSLPSSRFPRPSTFRSSR